jgi:hypothetical protein
LKIKGFRRFLFFQKQKGNTRGNTFKIVTIITKERQLNGAKSKPSETLVLEYRNVSRTLSYEVLFLCQNTEKGGRDMLRDDILEKLFSSKEMQELPIGYQSIAVSVLNKVLEEIKEESPYVTVSDLLSSTDVYRL